jgi:O-antigen ligase
MVNAMLIESAIAKMSDFTSGSVIIRAFKTGFRNLRKLSRNSAICRFLSKPERLTAVFYQSSFGRFAVSVPDAFTRTLKHFGVYMNRTLEGTLAFWILSWMAERFDLLFLLFVTAHALTPYAMYRNPYTIAALFILTLCACARVALVKNKSATFSLKRIDPVFLLYFLSVAASAVYSMLGAGRGAASMTTSLLYLSSLFFTILVANAFYEQKRLVLLIKVIVGTSVLVALYGILQYMRGIPVDVTQTDLTTGGASLAMGRADSTLGNPNVLAAWLLLVIPFSAALFFMTKNRIRKLFVVFITLPLVVCLLLTQSRSSWAGLFAACVVFVFFIDWRHGNVSNVLSGDHGEEQKRQQKSQYG